MEEEKLFSVEQRLYGKAQGGERLLEPPSGEAAEKGKDPNLLVRL